MKVTKRMGGGRNINGKSRNSERLSDMLTSMTGIYGPDVCSCYVLLMLTLAAMLHMSIFQMNTGCGSGENMIYMSHSDNKMINTNNVYWPAINTVTQCSGRESASEHTLVTRLTRHSVKDECTLSHHSPYANCYMQYVIIDRPPDMIVNTQLLQPNQPNRKCRYCDLLYTLYYMMICMLDTNFSTPILQGNTSDHMPLEGNSTKHSMSAGAIDPPVAGQRTRQQCRNIQYSAQVWSGKPVSICMRDRDSDIDMFGSLSVPKRAMCVMYMCYLLMIVLYEMLTTVNVNGHNSYVMSRRICKLRGVCGPSLIGICLIVVYNAIYSTPCGRAQDGISRFAGLCSTIIYNAVHCTLWMRRWLCIIIRRMLMCGKVRQILLGVQTQCRNILVISVFLILQRHITRCHISPGRRSGYVPTRSHGGSNRHMLQWAIITQSHRCVRFRHHWSSKVCYKLIGRSTYYPIDYRINNETNCDRQDFVSVYTYIYNNLVKW